MDTTIITALISATATVICTLGSIWLTAYLKQKEQQKKRVRRRRTGTP